MKASVQFLQPRGCLSFRNFLIPRKRLYSKSVNIRDTETQPPTVSSREMVSVVFRKSNSPYRVTSGHQPLPGRPSLCLRSKRSSRRRVSVSSSSSIFLLRWRGLKGWAALETQKRRKSLTSCSGLGTFDFRASITYEVSRPKALLRVAGGCFVSLMILLKYTPQFEHWISCLVTAGHGALQLEHRSFSTLSHQIIILIVMCWPGLKH